jgi:hypothetical protein
MTNYARIARQNFDTKTSDWLVAEAECFSVKRVFWLVVWS